MIRARLFRADKPPADVEPADAGKLSRDDGNLVWLDLERPQDEEIAAVTGVLRLDPRAVDLARQVNRRPTVRIYRDHFLVTVLGLSLDEESPAPRIEVVEIDLIVGKNFLVTLHKRPIPFAEEIVERTETNPVLGRFDATHLLYILLDGLLDAYSVQFDHLEGRVERMEERLLREPGQRTLNDAMVVKRHVQRLRHLVAPHRDAFSTLVAPDSPVSFRSDVDTTTFRDLVLRVDSLIQRLDHIRDVSAGAYSLYLSNISYRTNQQLKVLTFLSAVLLPMTVVTGLFGTNFKLTEYDSWEPFYLMLAGMGAITLGMLAYFRSRRWL